MEDTVSSKAPAISTTGPVAQATVLVFNQLLGQQDTYVVDRR